MYTRLLSYVLIYFLLLITTPAASQQFNISWGDNSRANYDYDDAIQLSTGNYLMLKYEKPKAFTIMKDRTPDPTLLLVDPNMNPLKENKLEIDEKNDQERAMRKFGNNLFLTYQAYKDKYLSAYAIKINPQTLQPGIRMTLGSFDSNGSDEQDIIYKVSADSTKILLFAEGPDRRKENKQFYIGVYDTDLKKIWSRYIELPIASQFVSIYDQDITNEGKIFVAIKHYDKEVTRQMVREEGNKVPSYTYKIFVYSKEGGRPKEISFDLKNHFIQGTKLVYGKNGVVTAAGLYKKKHNGNVTGTFYTIFDSTATIITNTKMVAFPQNILDLVDKDDQGKSDGSDPGLHSEFRINDIIPRNNGTVDLISEYYKREIRTSRTSSPTVPGGTTYVTIESYYRFSLGDIININLDKEGNAIFTRIPKEQVATHYDRFLSYYPVVLNDKLILFYNDHEDNMTRDLSKAPEHLSRAKKAVLAAAIIDAKGNLTRQAVYHFKEEKRVAIPKDFSRITPTQFLLVSMSQTLLSRKMGFGLLEIK